jgi:hypothetical protein
MPSRVSSPIIAIARIGSHGEMIATAAEKYFHFFAGIVQQRS